MTTPLLSIIICTYNRERLMKLCVDSCLSQNKVDMNSYEVIVVDNNSKDGTKDLVMHYRNKYPNVRYVFEKEQGLSHARNRGCIEAQAPCLAYLDDDAIAPPDYLRNVFHVMNKYSPDLMGGPIYPYYLSKKPRWFRDEYEIRKHADKSGFCNKCRISGGNFIIRKDVLVKLGMFNPNLGMIGDQVRLGEEREVLEKYRKITSESEQKTYYSLECGVQHYTPASKMTLRYVIKRGYNSGRSAARLKKKPPHGAIKKMLAFFPVLFSDLRRDLKIYGFKKADYVTIMSQGFIRLGNIVELLSHGPRAVLGPHLSRLSRRLAMRFGKLKPAVTFWKNRR